MLGEASTTEIAQNKNAQGFNENKSTARAGEKVAGSARKDLENRSGKKVITSKNYHELSLSGVPESTNENDET